MARPLADELLRRSGRATTSSASSPLGSGGAILSAGGQGAVHSRRCPDLIIIDAFGASETGANGRRGRCLRRRPARGSPSNDSTAVLDEDLEPVEPGSGVSGHAGPHRPHPARLLQGRGEDGRAPSSDADGERWVIPGDFATVEADGTITLLGRGSVMHQLRRREDLPRGGRGRAQEPPRRLRRHRRRRARRALGPAGRRRRRPAPGHDARASRSWPTTPARKIAGYKVPRELHLVEAVTRSPSGKADYRWAKSVATGEISG